MLPYFTLLTENFDCWTYPVNEAPWVAMYILCVAVATPDTVVDSVQVGWSMTIDSPVVDGTAKVVNETDEAVTLQYLEPTYDKDFWAGPTKAGSVAR